MERSVMTKGPESSQVDVVLVDADVHPVPASEMEIRRYLPKPWSELPEQVFNLSLVLYLPPDGPMRKDSITPSGGPPASDPHFMRQQLLEATGIDYAILIPLVRSHPNPDYEAALSGAVNRWLKEVWLTDGDPGNRYWGSICVTAGAPMLAAEEISRWAGDGDFVQVRMNSVGGAPFGNPRYEPIYRAASNAGLPLALHFSQGRGMSLMSPVGFSSYYFEHHAMYPIAYMTHLTSMLFEGVFERFPDLKVVFVEGGYSWILPLMWRLDNFYREMGSEVPWLKRRPSEYIRDHVRFTSQPLEEPPRPGALRKALEWSGAGNLLMFSSDYPHWDFDDPKWALRRFPKSQRQGIAAGNALDLYGLPRTRLLGESR